jgi:muramoyltetrapeptide carboxypeptidase LdcA involved in peptidoglycan recycling
MLFVFTLAYVGQSSTANRSNKRDRGFTLLASIGHRVVFLCTTDEARCRHWAAKDEKRKSEARNAGDARSVFVQ